MGKFQVTPAQLSATERTLTEKNAEFRSCLSQLLTLKEELSAEWQGSASQAFDQVFEQNRDQWERFAGLIDQYIAGLEKVRQNYIRTEATNRTLALR